MSVFWERWLTWWCLAVAAFGVVLAGGAFESTEGPVRWLLGLLGGSADVELDSALRFSLAVLGAVTIGWSVTLLAALRAAVRLGREHGPSTWALVTASVAAWFLIDSGLSVATGFGLNVVSNIVLLLGFLLPVLRSGVLRR
jgi:hypothetical protein